MATASCSDGGNNDSCFRAGLGVRRGGTRTFWGGSVAVSTTNDPCVALRDESRPRYSTKGPLRRACYLRRTWGCGGRRVSNMAPFVSEA
jgi:hypothetical protein